MSKPSPLSVAICILGNRELNIAELGLEILMGYFDLGTGKVVLEEQHDSCATGCAPVADGFMSDKIITLELPTNGPTPRPL